MRNWPIAAGEFFTERDVPAADKVCVIGQTLVTQAVPRQRPDRPAGADQEHPVPRRSACWSAKGANLVGDDQDDILLMPYTTVQKRLQGSTVLERRR